MIALVALGDDQEDGRTLSDREQALHELHGRRVGPVEILEDDHEWAILSELPEKLVDDLERPVLQGLRREIRELRRRVGLGRETEERAQVRVDLALPFSEEIGESATQPDADPELRVVHRRAEPLAKEIPEGPVRQRLAVRHAPAFEPEPLVLGAGIGQQAALPDSGLARDDEHAAAAGNDPGERLAHERELVVATDERRVYSDDTALLDRIGPRMDGAVRDDGLRLPLQLVLDGRVPVEEGLGEPVGRRVDEDRAGLGCTLEPRSSVDRVAERGVLDPLPRAERSNDDRTGGDPDAYTEARDAPASLHLGCVRTDRLDDRETCQECPLRIVLGRRGRTEEREHAVAGKVLHVATEPLDLDDDAGHGIGHDQLHLGVVELLCEGGRADQVGEQSGDRAALLADRGPGVGGLRHGAILSTIARRCARSG